MAYFPIFTQIEGKRCFIVGGGKVAARKVHTLLQYGADVVVAAEKVCRLNARGNREAVGNPPTQTQGQRKIVRAYAGIGDAHGIASVVGVVASLLRVMQSGHNAERRREHILHIHARRKSTARFSLYFRFHFGDESLMAQSGEIHAHTGYDTPSATLLVLRNDSDADKRKHEHDDG